MKKRKHCNTFPGGKTTYGCKIVAHQNMRRNAVVVHSRKTWIHGMWITTPLSHDLNLVGPQTAVLRKEAGCAICWIRERSCAFIRKSYYSNTWLSAGPYHLPTPGACPNPSLDSFPGASFRAHLADKPVDTSRSVLFLLVLAELSNWFETKLTTVRLIGGVRWRIR